MPPSRNAPCPCGSGKKYKKCCMLKESAPDLTYRLLRQNADKMPSLLLEYAKKTFGQGAIFEAWDTFWAGVEEQKDFKVSSHYFPLFTPWFIYHWYPEGEGRVLETLQYPRADTVAARFLGERGPALDSLAKRFLETACKEPLTFWQVEAAEPGKGMLLKDLVTGSERFVHEVTGSKRINKWDIIFGQIVGLDGKYILHASGPYAFPPKTFRESIEEFISKIEGGCSFAPVDLLEFDLDFITFYHRCVEELHNPVLPELRNTDNEKLVFTTSRYTFDPGSREGILMKLNSMEDIDHKGKEEKETEFVWVVEDEKAAMQVTVKGHIKVGRDYLLVECNSKPRDSKLRKRMEKEFGKMIRYEDTTYKPFSFDQLPKEPKESKPLDLNELPKAERQQVTAFLEQQYMGWVNQRVPALQNKTPREAVKTPEGRKKVIDLVNDWENSQIRMPNPQFKFDFNKLRKALGLEME